MISHSLIFLQDLKHIFSKKRGVGTPLRIFFTHLRLKFKQKFFQAFSLKKTKENFLGLTVFFPDYGSFCHMWREIFVLENYYFKSENKAPRIIDVGSNIGMSICFFKLLYPESEIIGIEPDPQAFVFLLKNIKANGFKNVAVRNAAVSRSGGKIPFYQHAGFAASAINSTMENFLPPERQERIEVPSSRLSEFIKEKTDLLKICAEGVEYEILEEAEKDLHFVGRIFAAVHQREGAKNEKISKLFGLLEANGFRYAITSTPISHGDFAERPKRAYAFTLDAVRF